MVSLYLKMESCDDISRLHLKTEHGFEHNFPLTQLILFLQDIFKLSIFSVWINLDSYALKALGHINKFNLINRVQNHVKFTLRNISCYKILAILNAQLLLMIIWVINLWVFFISVIHCHLRCIAWFCTLNKLIHLMWIVLLQECVQNYFNHNIISCNLFFRYHL